MKGSIDMKQGIRLDKRQIEVVDDEMAEVLRGKTNGRAENSNWFWPVDVGQKDAVVTSFKNPNRAIFALSFHV